MKPQTLTLPTIVTREAIPYLGIRGRVPMSGIPGFVDTAFPALLGWIEEKGIAQQSPAFLKYNIIDMAGILELEAGVAVADPVPADGEILAGLLPAGRYATTTYTGPYDDLLDVNALLIGWAKERDIAWDCAEKPDGDHFACRLEIYVTDPVDEPDSGKWVTALVIKIAD